MRVLRESDRGFAEEFAALLTRQRDDLDSVANIVADIISGVRRGGDAALHQYTATFDRHSPASLRVPTPEIADLAAQCSAPVRAALRFAAERIESYHRALLPSDIDFTDATGVRLGARWSPIDAVGIYVPGGTAAYPSSVLMNAMPAKVAGVGRIAMTVPTPDGHRNPAIFAAAAIAGVTEIHTVGGAQAIAALAYGTETIRAVDKIVGPGNIYVAAAKRAVFGKVGIDTIAGPSEITVVADRDNDPAWIAADLLSQAEHDENAQSILITDDRDFAATVATEIEQQLATLPREATARLSWQNNGAIVLVGDLARVPDLVNRIAPEHLELAVAEPDILARDIRHAGAIFLGRWTPETLGDYVGGPNHVLPTSGAARFASGLGVHDFLKRTSILECTPASFTALAGPAITLAEAEGLAAHGRAAQMRLALDNRDGDGNGR
jgi:histidinol dehydrogenase